MKGGVFDKESHIWTKDHIQKTPPDFGRSSGISNTNVDLLNLFNT